MMNNKWQIIRLEEVVFPASRPESIDVNKEYKLLGVRLEGNGPFLREIKAGYELSANKLFQVKRGDFIYSRLFAWRGAFGIINNELDGCYVSNEFPVFQVNPDTLNIKFLWYWFRLPETISQVEANCTGSKPLTRNRFKENFFLDLEISLPPLSEQQRIVAKIEQLAAKVEKARNLREKVEKETTQLKASFINEIEAKLLKKFDTVELSEISHSITDGDHQPPPKPETGIPFIFISNMITGRVDFTSCKYVLQEYYDSLSSSRKAQKGDILYSAVGSYGMPCVVDFDDPFCFQRHIAIIKPNSEVVDSEYMAWMLQSPLCFMQATEAATGSAQLTVPLRAIRRLRIPLAPLEEQHHIVTYLNNLQGKIDSLKQFQTQTHTELDALLPSILDKAFKGEL